MTAGTQRIIEDHLRSLYSNPYVFYLPDEESPASAACLFSSNALSFIPLDGLADVGEYTSKKILQFV